MSIYTGTIDGNGNKVFKDSNVEIVIDGNGSIRRIYVSEGRNVTIKNNSVTIDGNLVEWVAIGADRKDTSEEEHPLPNRAKKIVTTMAGIVLAVLIGLVFFAALNHSAAKSRAIPAELEKVIVPSP